MYGVDEAVSSMNASQQLVKDLDQLAADANVLEHVAGYRLCEAVIRKAPEDLVMATMAATPPEKVVFALDEPVMVTLMHPAGNIVSSADGESVTVGMADGRMMFLNPGVAQKLNLLEAQPGESVCICRRCDGQQQVRWELWLSPATISARAARPSSGAGEYDLMAQLVASLTEINERRRHRRKPLNHDEAKREQAEDIAAAARDCRESIPISDPTHGSPSRRRRPCASLKSSQRAKPAPTGRRYSTMATQPNRTPREIVDFPANVPVRVALQYAQGKTISNQYGERMMFSLVGNRVMFLDLDVAGQIAELGINVRENFTLTRKWDGQKGSAVTWEVARVPGEQPNGTLILPAAESHSDGATPAATSVPSKPPGWAKVSASSLLIDEANALVDAYAQILERTLNTYQGRIKPEEARSLLVTAYIQRAKLSSVA